MHSNIYLRDPALRLEIRLEDSSAVYLLYLVATKRYLFRNENQKINQPRTILPYFVAANNSHENSIDCSICKSERPSKAGD
jgi:hypothetical protein